MKGNELEHFYMHHLDKGIKSRADTFGHNNVTSDAWKNINGVTPFFYDPKPREEQESQKELALKGRNITPSTSQLAEILEYVFKRRLALKGAIKIVAGACRHPQIKYPKTNPHSVLIDQITQRAFDVGNIINIKKLPTRSMDLIQKKGGEEPIKVHEGTIFEAHRRAFAEPLTVRAQSDMDLAAFLTMSINLGALTVEEQVNLIENPWKGIKPTYRVETQMGELIVTNLDTRR